MSCNNEVSMESDIICLDSSQDPGEYPQQVEEEEGLITDVTVCDRFGTFDTTLPAGIAPEGFILLDESVEINNGSRATSPEIETSTNEPTVKVIFRNEHVARKYRKKIQDFVTHLIGGEAENEKNTLQPTLNFWSSNRAKKSTLVDDGRLSLIDNTLFMIDNNPGPQDSLDIPTYGKKFEKVLKDVDEESETEEKAKAGAKLNCFNCLGNHNLRDCPQPRHSMEINKNRKEFNNRHGPKSIRYHVDEATKFNHFKPGVLSDELKKALGLAVNQLPKHIYKMRILGYPPGWLEEARLQHSGINLYNSEGLRESEPGEERGGMFSPESRNVYDIKKVHDFPGYNTPAPEGTVCAFWKEEQQEFHSKNTMLAKMIGRQVGEGYKKKKLRRTTPSQDSSHVQSAEMDIELIHDTPVESVEVSHLIPPLPDELKASQDAPPPPLEIDEISHRIKSTSRVASPSLSELQNMKQELLYSLQGGHSQPDPGTPVKLSSNMSISNILETPHNLRNIGRVTSVELGTPILQSTSPFTKLPTSERFSENICDVINFENLPNSIGKYDQMTELLQKVRGTLSHSLE